jgi:hypothetical protein
MPLGLKELQKFLAYFVAGHVSLSMAMGGNT